MSRSRLGMMTIAAGLPLAILFAIGLVWSGDSDAPADPRVMDFGHTAPSRTLSHRFILHNATGRSITFRDLDAGDLCRCHVELPEHPDLRIPADTVFPVDVRMTAPESAGPFFRHAVLRTDSEMIGFETIRLSMSGAVVESVQAHPRVLAFDADSTPENSEREFAIETEEFDLPAKLIDVQSDLKHVTLEPLAATPHRLRYRVRIDETMPLGAFRGTIIASFRDPRLGAVRIRVIGEQRSDIDAVPAIVSWNLRRGEPGRYRLRLESRSGLPISVQSVSEPEGVTVRFDQGLWMTHDLELVIDPSAKPQSVLRIITSREDGAIAETGIRLNEAPRGM